MRYSFAGDVSHGIGELYFTADLNSADLTRNVETVAFAQYDVVVAAGIGQCFVEFDTYYIGVGNIEFGERTESLPALMRAMAMAASRWAISSSFI